jgi:carbon storage regulator CsrA
MLVLTRRTDETIVFPELDIKIEVLQMNGSKVRVGIDAPIEIKVLRGELSSPDQKEKVAKKILVDAEGAHEIRNRLNTLSVAAGLTKKLLSQGKTNVAANILSDALDSLASPPAASSKPTVSQPTKVGPRALLIEDAANEREMLAGFLRLHGYQVDTVVDGIEAIDFLEDNEKPDFILVDMNLPRLNGANVIRKVRANPGYDNVEIFAVSGHTPDSAGVDVKENRIADWFQKPLQPSGLVASINRHLHPTCKSEVSVVG